MAWVTEHALLLFSSIIVHSQQGWSASSHACEALLQQCRKYLHNTYTKLEPKPKIVLVHDIFISVIKAKIKLTTP